jgi:hypothetical protein
MAPNPRRLLVLVGGPFPGSQDDRAGLMLASARAEVLVGARLVADDPIAMLGQQRVDRALRQQLRAPHRVEKTPLSIRHRKHPSLSASPKPLGLQEKNYGTDRTEQAPSQRTF